MDPLVIAANNDQYSLEQIKNLAHRAAQMLLGTPYATDRGVEINMSQTGDVCITLRSVEDDYTCIVPREMWIKELTS